MKHETRNARHEARILVMAMMAVCSAVALAMPTQQQLKKAQPLVAELMAPIMDDFKAKKKTAAEVADAAVKYAAEAETEAAKFMLYRSSIPYFVRGEAYDKAADAVELMKANVKDVPASVVEEIISKATVRANREKAPRLFELYQQAKTQATAEKDVKELRKKPASSANRRKLAEALATAGDWQEALKVFASLTDQAAKMAKGEQDGSAKSAELGEFWWAYKPTYEDAEDTFKIHAAVHYRKALAAGEITGLKKNIVEQRIKEFGDAAETVNGEVKTVSGKQMATRQLTHEGFLTRVNTLLWDGVSVNDIQSFTATMSGSSVSNPGEVVGFVVDSGDGWKAVQFQRVDGEHLKCVYARFEQRGNEVRGYAEGAAYTGVSVAMGTDFRTVTSARKYSLSADDKKHGYGIKDLVVTVGGKGAAEQAPAAKDLYCVIDLSGGPDAKKYPVSYLSDVPKGGWSDEYKTTKLVLRRVESGTFKMGKPGDSRRVEISKPFYAGVFEVTQKQWELVMDGRPSFWKGPHWQVRPVEMVTYIRTRGNNAGLKWPESDEVDSDSFFGRMRQKTGLRFDLPTEAQWEYACRAGTETDYNNGCDKTNSIKDSALDKIGRYGRNSGWDEDALGLDFGKADRNCETNFGTAAVGSYQPNRWGLFDMSGNVHEQCLDRGEGKSVVLRGGNWWSPAIKATSWFKHGTYYDKVRPDTGFRLFLVISDGKNGK